MLKSCFVVSTFSMGLIALGVNLVLADDYPVKPIHLVTGSIGGTNDFLARLIAQGISVTLGQNVVVENRQSNLVGEFVAKAPPDGYTLLAAGGAFMIGSLLLKTSYDPVRDFSPITLASISPDIVVVHPSLPVKSVKELTALAKARPGELNYASGATGGSPHLAGELFKAMAGVNIVRIPYKGGGPALIGLISGQVQLMFTGMSAVGPHIKVGRLRALAVASAQPSAVAPGLPTVAAAGLPGYESGTTQGVWAPAKTPPAIITRLNQEIVRFLNRADVKERLLITGVEAAPTSPEQFAATIESDMARLGKVIKDARISVE